jgi:hypothetical protein
MLLLRVACSRRRSLVDEFVADKDHFGAQSLVISTPRARRP